MKTTDYPMWDDSSIPPSSADVLDLILRGENNMLSKRFVLVGDQPSDDRNLLRLIHNDHHLNFDMHVSQMLGQVDEEHMLFSHHVVRGGYRMQDEDFNSSPDCLATPENIHVRLVTEDNDLLHRPENVVFYQVTLHNRTLDNDTLLVVDGTVGGFDDKSLRDLGMQALTKAVHAHKINAARRQYQMFKLAVDIEGRPAMPKIEQFELENKPCQKETDVQ
jgi:hypothetical protein